MAAVHGNPWRFIPLASLIIIAAAIIAYFNSFSGVFLFDDMGTLVEKRVDWIHGSRHLVNYTFALNWSSPLGDWLASTFGADWAGGANTRQWHLFNLIVHIISGLAAFGVVHRTLKSPRIAAHIGPAALPLALAAALIFTVHPLQTEAVTYIYQRAQAAMGMFTLISMYCAIRAADRRAKTESGLTVTILWWLAASLSWLCAMDSKPHVLFFPIIAICHHRAFFATTWKKTAAQVWPLALGFVVMAAIWAKCDNYDLQSAVAPAPTAQVPPGTTPPPTLAALQHSASPSTPLVTAILTALHSAAPLLAAVEPDAAAAAVPTPPTNPSTAPSPAFSAAPVAAPPSLIARSLTYLRSQPQVICRYIALVFWPDHLCLDYEWVGPHGDPGGDELVCDCIVAALALATLYGTVRGAAWGFLGLWFFGNLVATSTLIPRPDLAVEHRMYLPLLSLAVAVPLTIWMALTPPIDNEKADEKAETQPAQKRLRFAALITLAITLPMVAALTWRTHLRNQDYLSAIAMWQNIVDQRPDNARAHTNLGSAQEDQAKATGDGPLMRAALDHYEKSVELNPRYPETRNSYGNALADAGRTRDAIAQYEMAIQLHPGYTEAYSNLGAAYLDIAQRENDAAMRERGIVCIRKSIETQWNLPQSHLNLGTALTQSGRLDEAVAEFKNAIICNPVYPDAHHNLGTVYLMQKNFPAALEEYKRSRDLDPSRPNYHRDLAYLDHQTGHDADALQEYAFAIATTAPGSPLRLQYDGELATLNKELNHPTSLDPVKP